MTDFHNALKFIYIESLVLSRTNLIIEYGLVMDYFYLVIRTGLLYDDAAIRRIIVHFLNRS